MDFLNNYIETQYRLFKQSNSTRSKVSIKMGERYLNMFMCDKYIYIIFDKCFILITESPIKICLTNTLIFNNLSFVRGLEKIDKEDFMVVDDGVRCVESSENGIHVYGSLVKQKYVLFVDFDYYSLHYCKEGGEAYDLTLLESESSEQNDNIYSHLNIPNKI